MAIDDLRIGNGSMAIGRIGVAIILVPIVWGVSFLLVSSEGPARAPVAGVVLFLIGAGLAWQSFRVPLSVSFIGDTFVVRRVFGTVTADIADILRVDSGLMRSTIGPGSRRHPCVTIRLQDGRLIRIGGDSSTLDAIRSRIPQLRDGASGIHAPVMSRTGPR
jgi:hypothetical protein